MPFPKIGRNIAQRFNFLQTIYLANLDGATDHVTLIFFCNRREADTKMFAYIKFLCDNICLNRVAIVSPYISVAVISSYESVTNLTYLDAIRSKTGAEDYQRYIYLCICYLQN